MRVHIKIARYAESREAIQQVRDTVFGVEQNVSRELDYDGRDSECVHVLAMDEKNQPVGTGRLQLDGRIGRLAVLRSCRRLGVGRQMLARLVAAARERGLSRVYLHAQTHALAFYEGEGFQREGDEFDEAGIPHVNMTRELR
jgi:predicted GNAT family N-acyltransferase